MPEEQITADTLLSSDLRRTEMLCGAVVFWKTFVFVTKPGDIIFQFYFPCDVRYVYLHRLWLPPADYSCIHVISYVP